MRTKLSNQRFFNFTAATLPPPRDHGPAVMVMRDYDASLIPLLNHEAKQAGCIGVFIKARRQIEAPSCLGPLAHAIQS